MKLIQDKEYAIKFLLARARKHMTEAFNKLDSFTEGKNCVDISIILLDRIEKEIDEYTKLLAHRLHHYSNVAANLSDRMSRFSDEINAWKEEQEQAIEDATDQA